MNSCGNPWKRSEGEVLSFTLAIASYFSLIFLTLSPYQGTDPFRKNKKMYPRFSISSHLDSSLPKWVLMDKYLDVPLSGFPSAYGMCSPWELKYFLARLKFHTKNLFLHSLLSNAKYSGCKSLWRNPLEWIYSTRSIIWSASIKTVFRENFPWHFSKSCYRVGPTRSIIMKVCSPWSP